MPARSENFPWPSHYDHFQFFEDKMKAHRLVRECVAQGGGVYDLTRCDGQTIRVFICECYAYGVAEYMETVASLGKVDAIIINSFWCGYTQDAKIHCREQNVGLFRIGEFMAALSRSDYWNYK